MSLAPSLARAGRWFLDSGIQEPSGGVARFYCSDIRKKRPVSTEITGYTASTLVWLFEITGDDEYLERALLSARFLLRCAWDQKLKTFPFEHPSPSVESDHLAYFFDCGIIIRGLLAVWRHTREPELLDVAGAAARGMITDFGDAGEYYPVLALPGKKPLPCEDRWSRSPGCYQLKAALAWREVATITGDQLLMNAYIEALGAALATHTNFLREADKPDMVMDRLHAYGYFLEGLTPVLERQDCALAYAGALDSISCRLRAIAPVFARSDVYAQVLRARIYGASRVAMDESAATAEAEALLEFQAFGDDPGIDCGFLFGRRDGRMLPHVNPVSTAFALQALELWRTYQAGSAPPCPQTLV